MNKDVEKIIIFPDIHGRKFWIDIERKYLGKPEYGFIFLGDYFDPYDFEGITEDDALNNFRDMWNIFSHFDNVVWLLGNHDYHYLPWMSKEWGCRRSRKNFDIISKFFVDNFDKFNIAYECQINNKDYIFTHAGISCGWTMQFENPDNCYCAEFLNNLKTPENSHYLWQISWERGGNDKNGSPIWADHYEMSWTDHKDEVYQIFGHTLSYPDFNTPVINDRYAMLDARKAFVLDCKTGKIDLIK